MKQVKALSQTVDGFGLIGTKQTAHNNVHFYYKARKKFFPNNSDPESVEVLLKRNCVGDTKSCVGFTVYSKGK